MLGILLAVDDGLLQVIPGMDAERAIEGPRMTAVDYRDGLAVATAPGEGIWVNEDGEGSMDAPSDWADAVLVDFVNAVATGGKCEVPYEEGVKSLAISLAGYLSAERGSEPVELAEILPEGV